MRRIFGDYAYGPGPRDGCWWDETIAEPDWPRAEGRSQADVTVIGGGFTGISTALHLAEAGVSVTLLEAEAPGFGASGRNGGFCCLGGAMASDAALDRQSGPGSAKAWRKTERQAVELVAELIARHGIEADTHSKGETKLAHRPRDMEKMKREAEAWDKDDGPEPRLTEAADLAAEGLGGPFFGALTLPVGFGLNPRKYLFGLARAAEAAGARLHAHSPVTSVEKSANGYRIVHPRGTIESGAVVFCTNGYSSEDLPPWFASRYIPAQSNVLVTRPLSQAELDAQGWTSDQMAYDTRGLLHYFRLMPDRRFLFGMRGGLLSSPQAEARARERNLLDFKAMFPAWTDVETPQQWSGMVCLTRARRPFVGPVPDMPGAFAGLAYHGNGVAMGSLSGRLLARLILGHDEVPQVLSTPLPRFPLGLFRRVLMPPFYIARALADR